MGFFEKKVNKRLVKLLFGSTGETASKKNTSSTSSSESSSGWRESMKNMFYDGIQEIKREFGGKTST